MMNKLLEEKDEELFKKQENIQAKNEEVYSLKWEIEDWK